MTDKFPGTSFYLTGVLFFCVLGAAVYGVKLHKEKASRDAFSVELNTTFAEPLKRHGITEISAAKDGLLIVANGKTICLIDVSIWGGERYRIVEQAVRVGCDESAMVALLDPTKMFMRRGSGTTLAYAALDDSSVRSKLAADGAWVTSRYAGGVIGADFARKFAEVIIDDIDGLMPALAERPELAMSPSQLQATVTAL